MTLKPVWLAMFLLSTCELLPADAIVYVCGRGRVNRAMVIACLVKSVALVMIITRQVIAIDARSGSSFCRYRFARPSHKALLIRYRPSHILATQRHVVL